MIEYDDIQLACRARALTLEVATTGSNTLAASSSGFTRSSGSFLTDGFRRGMEVLCSGFSKSANNARHYVENVTATLLTVSTSVTEGSGSGKTISVPLPQYQAWENIEHEPTPGAPWVEEQFLPGPTRQFTVGLEGTLEARPIYGMQVHVPENVGVGAPNRYADALIRHFKPLTAMTLDNGDVVRVRTDTGPFRGQLIRRKPGFVTVPVSFPLFMYTTNN